MCTRVNHKSVKHKQFHIVCRLLPKKYILKNNFLSNFSKLKRSTMLSETKKNLRKKFKKMCKNKQIENKIEE